MGYLDNIPQAMRECKQWMLAGPDKAPRAVDYANETSYPGAKNNPAQRMDYNEARYWAEHLGLYMGFVPLPSDPFTIIDLDWKDSKVYDVDANDLKIGLYQQAVQETYVERSLSGKGVHIVVEGKLAHDFNASTAGVECYGNKGFVVITGQLESVTNAISQQQSWLDYLATKYRRAFEDAAVSESYNKQLVNDAPKSEIDLDDALIASMSTWRNTEKLSKYFYGQDLRPDGGGGSEGDLALIQAFLKFTQSEHKPEAAMRMFMRTPRAKLREPYKRATSNWDQYLGRTLYGAKVRVLADEKRAKDFDMGTGSRAMIEQYLAQMSPQPAAETESGQAPINMGGMGQRAPVAIEAEAPFAGFKWLSKTDLENQPKLEWAVKGLFPAAGVGAIYGESGAGKSFVAIDLVAAIAEGRKWFNLRTKQLPVSVFALEGEGGLKGRVKAWESVNKRSYPESVFFWDSINNGQFALRDGSMDSSNRDYHKKRLIQLCADLIANGRRGGVVVIDTLNQASDGADENSSRDMGELLRAMKFIQRETDSLVIIVHHATKSKENQSMRGHSSLYGAMDGIMEVLREVWTTPPAESDEKAAVIEGRRGWRAVKVKDGRDGYEKHFAMKEVQVDMDEDGPVFSVAIEPIEPFVVTEDGEVIHVDVGSLKRPEAQSARSGKGRVKRPAGDRQAPPVTRTGAQNAPVWNASERAAPINGSPDPINGHDAANAAMGWSGIKPQDAIRQAIIDDCSAAKSSGKYGGELSYCAPRSDTLTRAIILRNYPNPSVGKRDLDRAIDAMIASGKLGSKMENGKIQWLWIGGNSS